MYGFSTTFTDPETVLRLVAELATQVRGRLDRVRDALSAA